MHRIFNRASCHLFRRVRARLLAAVKPDYMCPGCGRLSIFAEVEETLQAEHIPLNVLGACKFWSFMGKTNPPTPRAAEKMGLEPQRLFAVLLPSSAAGHAAAVRCYWLSFRSPPKHAVFLSNM